MPPKARFTREEVIGVALELIKREGAGALTARNLSGALGCSVCPIFTLFTGMEEVQAEVVAAANALYTGYIEEDMRSGKYPPYKGSGMAYIRFAREERELFKLVFMRDRSAEEVTENREAIAPLLAILQSKLGLTEEEAYLFHLEMWIYVHGVATMIATSYLDWNMDFVSRSLSDIYRGLVHRFTEGRENVGD